MFTTFYNFKFLFYLKVDKRAEVWEKEFSRIMQEYHPTPYFTHTKYINLSTI